MELKEKIAQKEKEAEVLKSLVEIFPDLKEHRDRWGNIRLMSKAINDIADEVFMNHNCGCCSDSPLQAWPYKEFEGTKVFSDPTCFFVGEKNAGGIGDNPDLDWEERLREVDISQTAIDKIKEYFEDNKPKYWDLVEPN